MRILKPISVIISISLIILLAGCGQANNTVTVSSKNFTEQIILGELVAQALEAKTDLNIKRRLFLGGALLCHQALKAGQIDVYVEYTGTALTSVLKEQPMKDKKAVFERVKQEYERQFNLTLTPSLGFNNTFAMLIRREEAEKLGIKTLSQATKYSQNWKAAFGFEFTERLDGFPGLSKAYNLKLAANPLIMDLGLMYQAIQTKQVDLVAGGTTDGLIGKLNLFILEDDKKYFPPYEATPVVRLETLRRHPEVKTVLESLSGLISEKEMQRLNYAVDGEKQDIKVLVREFLKSKGVSKKGKV